VARCELYIYHSRRTLTYNGGDREGIGAIGLGVEGRFLRRKRLSLTAPGLEGGTGIKECGLE